MRIGVVIALLLMMSAPVAQAATRSGSVDAVYQTDRCAQDPCTSGDPHVGHGAVVAGAIQIDVTVNSDDGLEWARLETRVDGAGSWLCLQRWDINGTTSFSASYTWPTRNFPLVTREWNCDESTPHMHGEPTRNGHYELRVIGHDHSDKESVAPPFTVAIENPPARVVVRGAGVERARGAPRARIGWYVNAEPDLIEYRILRIAPDRARLTIVIDAVDPGRSGCTVEHQLALQCFDESFRANGTGGRYTYTVSAFRAAVSRKTTCVLGRKQPCIGSMPSETMTVSIPGSFSASVPRGQHTIVPSTRGTPKPGSTHTPTAPPNGSTPSPTSHPSRFPIPSPPPAGGSSSGLWIWLIAGVTVVGAGSFGAIRLRSRSRP